MSTTTAVVSIYSLANYILAYEALFSGRSSVSKTASCTKSLLLEEPKLSSC